MDTLEVDMYYYVDSFSTVYHGEKGANNFFCGSAVGSAAALWPCCLVPPLGFCFHSSEFRMRILDISLRIPSSLPIATLSGSFFCL